MSKTAAPSIDLSGLAEAHEADFSVDGFHHRYAARADLIVRIAERFARGGWYCEMVTCEDRRADEGAMRLVYTFNRFDCADRHVVFVTVEGDIPGVEIASIAGVCPAADWLEREVFDMYGVRFAGHPNLERLLLPEDADFHALLKDFGRVEDAEASS